MTLCLVFGGGGQLGQEIAAHASGAVSAVVLARGETDISDPGAVAGAIARIKPQVVVNAGAYTKVDLAETEIDQAFVANETGPAVLARACAAENLPLVHISTDYVFDGTKLGAYREDDPIAPVNVYGRSKAAGEAAIRAVLDRHVILRTSWVYGIYGTNFLKTILRLAREREELRIVADQRGCPTGTADLAEAILRIVPRLAADEPLWGIYHFAGTGVATWHDFAREIVAAQAPLTGRNPGVVPIRTAEYQTAARRPANSELDSSRFAATFGFRAKDWRERTREVAGQLLA